MGAGAGGAAAVKLIFEQAQEQDADVIFCQAQQLIGKYEDAQSVEIEFEKEYYNYAGSLINTYITFSALNYLGEEFAGKFELTISGPAVFAENNSSTLRFMYDGEGKQQIEITITGASPITIYPKFIS